MHTRSRAGIERRARARGRRACPRARRDRQRERRACARGHRAGRRPRPRPCFRNGHDYISCPHPCRGRCPKWENPPSAQRCHKREKAHRCPGDVRNYVAHTGTVLDSARAPPTGPATSRETEQRVRGFTSMQGLANSRLGSSLLQRRRSSQRARNAAAAGAKVWTPRRVNRRRKSRA